SRRRVICLGRLVGFRRVVSDMRLVGVAVLVVVALAVLFGGLAGDVDRDATRQGLDDRFALHTGAIGFWLMLRVVGGHANDRALGALGAGGFRGVDVVARSVPMTLVREMQRRERGVGLVGSAADAA